jgi:hypothetical protein
MSIFETLRKTLLPAPPEASNTGVILPGDAGEPTRVDLPIGGGPPAIGGTIRAGGGDIYQGPPAGVTILRPYQERARLGGQVGFGDDMPGHGPIETIERDSAVPPFTVPKPEKTFRQYEPFTNMTLAAGASQVIEASYPPERWTVVCLPTAAATDGVWVSHGTDATRREFFVKQGDSKPLPGVKHEHKITIFNAGANPITVNVYATSNMELDV